MDEHLSSTAIPVGQVNVCPLPFCASRDDPAPLFTAEAYVNGQIQSFNLEEFRGKWVVLFFYASDFTFV